MRKIILRHFMSTREPYGLGHMPLNSYFSTYTLTHLLIYTMEQSPSLEAKRVSASQEIPRILRTSNVHYRSHKCHLSLSSVQVRGLLFDCFAT
jgi:hypothetical protein